VNVEKATVGSRRPCEKQEHISDELKLPFRKGIRRNIEFPRGRGAVEATGRSIRRLKIMLRNT